MYRKPQKMDKMRKVLWKIHCRKKDELIKLKFGSANEVEFVEWDVDTFEQRLDHMFVVHDSFLQQLPRTLHVVQVCVQVGEENRHLIKDTFTFVSITYDVRINKLTLHPALRKSATFAMGTK